MRTNQSFMDKHDSPKEDSRTGMSADYMNQFYDIDNAIKAATLGGTDGYRLTERFKEFPKLFMTIDKLDTPKPYAEVIPTHGDITDPEYQKRIEKINALRESFDKRDKQNYTLADLIAYRDETEETLRGMTREEARAKNKENRNKLF